jgi:hypothetical protein
VTRRAVRATVVVVAIMGLAVCAALAVREIVLADRSDVVWPLASWWQDMLASASWPLDGVIGIALLLVSGLCLALALALPLSVRSPRDCVALGDGAAGVELRLRGLERGLAAELRRTCPAIAEADVTLTSDDDGTATRLAGSVVVTTSPVGVAALQRQIAETVRRDVRAMTGLDSGPLTLEIARVLQPGGERP